MRKRRDCRPYFRLWDIANHHKRRAANNLRQRLQTRERKRLGQCIQCGGARDSSILSCSRCAEEQSYHTAVYYRKKRIASVIDKLCYLCGRPAYVSSYCEEHKNVGRLYAVRRSQAAPCCSCGSSKHVTGGCFITIEEFAAFLVDPSPLTASPNDERHGIVDDDLWREQMPLVFGRFSMMGR